MRLPFDHLNLRFNPFGELSRAMRAEVAVVDERLTVDEGQALQVMGDAGRGKTTTLLTLCARVPGMRYEYVPEGSDTVQTRPLPLAFALDEAQRVRPELLVEVAETCKRLVFGTHDDLSGIVPRPLRTVQVGGLDVDRLDRILRRRIEAARRRPGRIPEIPQPGLQRLVARFGDDLRTMEDHLYDVFQTLEEPGDVQV